MRKTLSIFLVLILLGISLHLGVASHFCGGELAQAKLVYGHGVAGCGMDCSIPSREPNPQETKLQKPSCCQDFIFTMAVDEYQPVSQKLFVELHQHIFPGINHIFTPGFSVVKTNFSNIPPPHITEVLLPFIQVFLI